MRLAAVLIALIAASVARAEPATLGDKVVAFCKEHMDKTVGNGECAGLATQALRAVGAKTRAGADSPNKGDYVWGRQVYMLEGTPDGVKEKGNLSDVRPGDVMQYRDVKIGEKGHFAHHTAIVAEVDEKAKTIKVYQQNAGGKRYVTEGKPRLNRMVEGWVRIYRPMLEAR